MTYRYAHYITFCLPHDSKDVTMQTAKYYVNQSKYRLE